MEVTNLLEVMVTGNIQSRAGESNRHKGPHKRQRRFSLRRYAALLGVLALVAAACSSAGEDTETTTTTVAESTETTEAPSGTDTTAPSTETTEAVQELSGSIDVWSWSPATEGQVALFEAANPNVTVNLINNGVGAAQYDAMQVAFAAGSGAPDVALIEYGFIPQWALSGDLLPIDDLGGSEIVGEYVDSIANQLIINGQLYGTAINAAPLALGYRSDLFAEAGITQLPETWGEFADAARTFKDTFPDGFILNGPISDGTFLFMLWQAGVTPIVIDGTTVAIDFTGDTANEVLSFWVDLAQQGLVGSTPSFTPEWNQAFADGTFGGWIMPAWGPIILGSNAVDTSGAWSVSRLPSQDGSRASAEWGGGAYSVMTQSDNPELAAAFVIFANHDPAATEYMAVDQADFSGRTEFLEDPEILALPFEFFGGQAINEVFAEEMKAVPREWQWSPFQSTLNQVFGEQVLAAQEGAVSVAEALQNIQDELVTFALDQGFTVSG